MSSLFPATEALLPGRVSLGMTERPSLVLANLLRMDPEAAALAAVSPGKLAPGQLRTIADEVGVGKENTLAGFAVRAATNPLVLIGAILALRYPIPRAAEMFKYAKDISGLNRVVGPLGRLVGNVDEIFAGLDIPENYKKLLRTVETFRVKYNTGVAAAITKAEKAGLPWDERTKVLLAAKLDGLDRSTSAGKAILRPIKEGQVFDKLVSETRVVMNGVRDELYGTAANRMMLRTLATRKTLGREGRMVAASMFEDAGEALGVTGPVTDTGKKKLLERASASLKKRVAEQMRAMGIGESGRFADMKMYEDYWPHQKVFTPAEFEGQTLQMLEQAGYRRGAYAEATGRAATSQTSMSALKRRHRMLPDPSDLEKISEYVKPGIIEKYRGLTGSPNGPLPYSLQFDRVYSSHVHGAAKAFGWTLTDGKLGNRTMPLGEALVSEAKQLEATSPERASMMLDSYISLALGRKSYEASVKVAAWAGNKIKLMRTLNDPTMKAILPEGVRSWMQGVLKSDKGVLSLQNMSARATGYLYTTALGANPVSAGWNLMQYLLTTVPTIGPKWAGKGLQSVLEKAPAYFKGRASGLFHEQALIKAFPDYAASGLTSQPLMDEALLKELGQAWEISLGMPTKVQRVADKVKNGMLALFQTTENIVRLGTFEGAKEMALSQGLRMEEALFTARRATEVTQFLSGPANVPAGLRELNPLLRMFGQFPLRTLGYTIGPATEMGSGAQAGFLNRNWGTLGRMLATGGLTYEAGKSFLDRDLSHGLIWGALPVPHPNQPFAPFPFVPPALSIAGSAAMDLLKGEFEETPRVLPLLVPGGLAASRLAGIAAPGVAAAVGRRHADYANRNEAGQVPVYDGNGGLIGYFSDSQLWADALGVWGGPGGPQRESELMQYLISQRDQIRGMRRNFLDSLAENDLNAARAVNTEFQKKYPFLGELQYTEKDLRAVHLRKAVPRLERVLDSLPAEARPEFARLLTTVLASEAESLMGVDPMLLIEQPTSKARDFGRPTLPTNAMDQLYRRQLDLHTAWPGNPGGGGLMPYIQQVRARAGRQSRFELNRAAHLGVGARSPFSSFQSSGF